MVRAVRPLRSLSMARGCARIDSRLDTAKIGSAGRLEVHRARLLAVIGVRKTFPHGLGHFQTSARKIGISASPLGTDIAIQISHVRNVPLAEVGLFDHLVGASEQ